MNADALNPDMRLRLAEAFETLAAVLEEETERVARAETDALDLYFNTKKRLFEQLGILLREANRVPALPVFPADSDAEMVAIEGPASAGDDAATPADPAPPARVRAAAERLRHATHANTAALQSAQEAVTAVTKRLARIAERQRTDGVYGRDGAAQPRTLPGYGRIEHRL